MALITCVDCKNEVSDKAAACPKCGWIPPPSAEKLAQAAEDEPPFILVGMVIVLVGGTLFITGAAGIYGSMAGMFGLLGGGGVALYGFFHKPKI